MHRALKAGAVLTAIVAGGIQLVPYGRDHGAPPVGAEAPWTDPEARELAVGACYDCHSSETRWPWYSNVAPLSWLVQRDVDRGRDELSFSDWDEGDGEDAAETIAEGDMPPRQYTWMHADARLGFEEKEALIEALEAMDEDSGRGRNRGRGGGD